MIVEEEEYTLYDTKYSGRVKKERNILTFKDYCIKNQKQYLLDQWDAVKNLPQTPETIRHSSTLKVWWKCDNGHLWQTQLRSRSTSLTGCPYCFNEKLCEKRKS